MESYAELPDPRGHQLAGQGLRLGLVTCCQHRRPVRGKAAQVLESRLAVPASGLQCQGHHPPGRLPRRVPAMLVRLRGGVHEAVAANGGSQRVDVARYAVPDGDIEEGTRLARPLHFEVQDGLLALGSHAAAAGAASGSRPRQAGPARVAPGAAPCPAVPGRDTIRGHE